MAKGAAEQKTHDKERIQSVDALRGLCVVLMIGHHFLYDMVVFAGAPEWFFFNPSFTVLQPLFAGCFIMLAGVSSCFSRNNVKRGLRVLAAAIAVTTVSLLMRMPILFGILHFLGLAMVLYGLTHGLWENLPAKTLLWFCALLLASSLLLLKLVEVKSHYLWLLGFTYEGFESVDFFPFLPWIFVFLFGTWLGRPLKERRLPAWVYTINPPLLPAVGRRAFIIYLLHQPVLYSLTVVFSNLN
jgi:uncharacterized membrane protein